MNPIEQAIAALERWAALIKHQYSGSSEAMSDLQEADNFGQQAHHALKAHQHAAQDVELPEPFYKEKSSFGWPDLWNESGVRAAIAAHQARQAVPQVDRLAQIIRTVDGANALGAGALAEKIAEALAAAPAPEAAQPTQAEAPSERAHIDKLIEYARKLLARRPRHPAEDANDRWEIAAAGLLGQFVAALATQSTYRAVSLDALEASLQAVPQGYALVHVDALKRWGVYDYVMQACVHPLKETLAAAPTPEASQPTQAEAPRTPSIQWHTSLAPLGFTDSEKSAWSVGVQHGVELEAALATHPAPEQVERDREDAARWRYARAHSYIEAQCSSPRVDGWSPTKTDAAIDAAREAQATKGGEA